MVAYVNNFAITLTLFHLISSCSSEKTMMDSLYDNLLNAQETMKYVASNVNIGLKSLAKSIKFVEKFVDSTIEEDCEFYCHPDEVPFPKTNHVPTVNGCGSLGIHVTEEELPHPEMQNCCNSHDICYDTCGSNKEDCDKKFKKCLYRVCDSHKEEMGNLKLKLCQGGAKILFTGTLALGCTSFKDAQESACLCQKLKTGNNKEL